MLDGAPQPFHGVRRPAGAGRGGRGRRRRPGSRSLALTDHDAIAGVAEASRGGRAPRGRAGARRSSVLRSRIRRRPACLRLLGSTSGAIAGTCERAQHERVHPRRRDRREAARGRASTCTSRTPSARPATPLSIGRPHIARAAGASGDLGPFFEEYLVPGAKAFVPRRWPTAKQAIELIRAAGGVAVIAHPYWDISEPGRGRRPDPLPGGRRGRDLVPRHTAGSRPSTCLISCKTSSNLVPDRLIRLSEARPTRPSPSSAPTRPTGLTEPQVPPQARRLSASSSG